MYYWSDKQFMNLVTHVNLEVLWLDIYYIKKELKKYIADYRPMFYLNKQGVDRAVWFKVVNESNFN